MLILGPLEFILYSSFFISYDTQGFADKRKKYRKIFFQ